MCLCIRLNFTPHQFAVGIAFVSCLGKHDWVAVLRESLSHFDAYRKESEARDDAGLAAKAGRILAGKDVLIILDNVELELDIAILLRPLRTADATVLLTAR